MKLAVSVLALLLAGCAAKPIDVTLACPPLRAWTAQEQKDLAAALAPVPQSSPIWTLELDWQATRDAIRACQKANNPTH